MMKAAGAIADFSKYGWRGSASYIGQNEDGTLGWMIGYAHLDAPEPHRSHQELVLRRLWYCCRRSALQSCRARKSAPSNSRDIRDGVMGTCGMEAKRRRPFRARPLLFAIQAAHGHRGAEWFADAWTDDVTYSNVQTETRGGNPFDVADHVTNVVPHLRWDDNKRTDHLFSAGLNNDFRLAEHTHLLADLSYSSNKRDETDIEIFGGYGCCAASTSDGRSAPAACSTATIA